MDHRMQIMQECRDYDLTTNSVKLVQQTTLSEDDSSACSWYPLQSTYLINWLKFKKSDENVHLWTTNTTSHMFVPFTGMSFINDSALQPMLHVNHPLLQFTDITDRLLSNAALFSRFYSHRIQTWAITTASFLARWILRFHMLYATEIGSSCDFWVSQGSAETYLRWGGESLWRACTEFPRESDSERIL